MGKLAEEMLKEVGCSAVLMFLDCSDSSACKSLPGFVHLTNCAQASFSWAWVLDERPEERARGVTVDVATTRFETPKFAVGPLIRAAVPVSTVCVAMPCLWKCAALQYV
eukprot:1154747-Pelagomonas_calceolata.AAC.8